MEGGVIATNQTTLMIDSIVELEITVTGGANDITVDDIIAANFNRWVDFEVTIVHNLGSNDTTAQVSLSPSSSATRNGMTFEQDTPLDSSSADELLRWTATAAPSTMELEPGEIGYGKVALAFNPTFDFPYPSAGTLEFHFEATC